MIGGHGAALAYGGTFAKMGYESAPLVGAAAATFGLITAVLIGGPLGRRLIEKNNLRPDNNENFDQSVTEINTDKGVKLSDLDIIKNVVVILLCMAIGSYISTLIGKLIKMDFPSYVGAMFVAVMCSGLCGHGLGATPSAIVNMTAINEKYGMSRKAMMIVPIVGAFLVDIIYQPATVWFIKTFVEGFVQ